MNIDIAGQMLSEEELRELDEFLLSDDMPESCMDISMLDGFLAAVVLTPQPILPNEWLPWVWDMESGEAAPGFTDLEQGRRILGYLMRYYNMVLASIEGGWFEPLLFELAQPDGSEFYNAEDWCLGFIVGTALFQRHWDPMLRRHKELIAPIYLLGTESGWKILEQSGDEKRAIRDAYEAIPGAVAALHDYFNPQRERQDGAWNSDFAVSPVTMRSEDAKTGRNDPCPCGSGKKFKKCCGAPEKLH